MRACRSARARAVPVAAAALAQPVQEAASDGRHAVEALSEWAQPAGAKRHSVNVDAQGGVWYMGNGNGTIGRFDPGTGRATEYCMPAPDARDPHDRRGRHAMGRVQR